MAPRSFAEDFAHIDELTKLTGSRESAEELLRKLDIPLVYGVFSRRHFDKKVNKPSKKNAKESPSTTVELLKHALEPYGLGIHDVRPGKTLTVHLHALDGTRRIESFGGGAPIEVNAQSHVRARVHHTGKLHSGAAQFTVSSLGDKEAPDVYFFLCEPESKIWMACRDELSDAETELRQKLAGGAAPTSELSDSMGYALHGDREGYLRIWIAPRRTTSPLHLQERIADEHGALVSKAAGIAY